MSKFEPGDVCTFVPCSQGCRATDSGIGVVLQTTEYTATLTWVSANIESTTVPLDHLKKIGHVEVGDATQAG